MYNKQQGDIINLNRIINNGDDIFAPGAFCCDGCGGYHIKNPRTENDGNGERISYVNVCDSTKPVLGLVQETDYLELWWL